MQDACTHLHIKGAGSNAWQEALAHSAPLADHSCERISPCTVLGQGTQPGTRLLSNGLCPGPGRLQYGVFLGVEETLSPMKRLRKSVGKSWYRGKRRKMHLFAHSLNESSPATSLVDGLLCAEQYTIASH